jgi:hypothetical protein
MTRRIASIALGQIQELYIEGVVMSAITMADLSASDAEELLVEVWLLLEKHQVASPKVAVKSLSNHLQIRLRFTLKQDADLVRSGLEDWTEKRGIACALRDIAR